MATGWQMSLDDYKAGRGGYVTPDPNQLDSCQDILNYRGKIISFRDDISNRLGDFSKSDSLNPMKELISLFNAKIALYDTAVAACQSDTPPGAAATDTATQSQVSDASTPDKADTLNPNGPTASGAKVASSNKKIIIIASGIGLLLIVAAIVIRKRMKS